jgi:hypothetical protein
MLEVPHMKVTTITFDDTIVQVFSEDHERLDELLELTVGACRRDAPREARAAFYAYEDSLRHHIRVEDDRLFVGFGEHTGLHKTGPAAILRREHRDAERRLDDIGSALDGEPDLGEVERQLRTCAKAALVHCSHTRGASTTSFEFGSARSRSGHCSNGTS